MAIRVSVSSWSLFRELPFGPSSLPTKLNWNSTKVHREARRPKSEVSFLHGSPGAWMGLVIDKDENSRELAFLLTLQIRPFKSFGLMLETICYPEIMLHVAFNAC